MKYLPQLSVFGSHIVGYFDPKTGRHVIDSVWVTEIDARNACK